MSTLQRDEDVEGLNAPIQSNAFASYFGENSEAPQVDDEDELRNASPQEAPAQAQAQYVQDDSFEAAPAQAQAQYVQDDSSEAAPAQAQAEYVQDDLSEAAPAQTQAEYVQDNSFEAAPAQAQAQAVQDEAEEFEVPMMPHRQEGGAVDFGDDDDDSSAEPIKTFMCEVRRHLASIALAIDEADVCRAYGEATDPAERLALFLDYAHDKVADAVLDGSIGSRAMARLRRAIFKGLDLDSQESWDNVLAAATSS